MKWICYFFPIFLLGILNAEIPIWKYDRSLIQGCVKIKKKNSSYVIPNEVHVVFLDQKRNHFIKIYQPSPKRTQSIKKANKRNVFDEISALKAILFDSNDNFCGFVSYRCRPLYPYTLIEEKAKIIDPSITDIHRFWKMVERMREKVLETGFYYGDCSSRNVGILGDKCCIFDLDEVVELDELLNLNNYKNVNYYLFNMDELKRIASEYKEQKERKKDEG